MAKLVLGIGTTHSPMLSLTSEQWINRANADYANKSLYLSDGRKLNYEQLLEEIGPRYQGELVPELMKRKELACAQAIEQLADALEKAQPDVVIIVGDDQGELFSAANQPVVALYTGEVIETLAAPKYNPELAPDWMRQVGAGCLMDDVYKMPGAQSFALELIEGLVDLDVDMTAVASVPDPRKAGFGHAYGFIVKRLFRGRTLPIVPLMLNTYFPPNVPTSARAYELGRKLRQVVEASPQNLRVAIIASGGLSHFVVDEVLDRNVLAALQTGDSDYLRSVPRPALKSGNSEILNWILAAGALEHLHLSWSEYQALYRSTAGTGVGAGFCIWD